MTLQRKANWLELLLAFVAQRKSAPFEWGKNDCCLFAADAVNAITGHDYGVDFRGKYSTAIGAARALKKYGAGDIETTLINLLGEPITRLNLSRGDVVLGWLNDRATVGIMLTQPVGPGLCGLQNFPLSDVKHGWRVG